MISRRRLAVLAPVVTALAMAAAGCSAGAGGTGASGGDSRSAPEVAVDAPAAAGDATASPDAGTTVGTSQPAGGRAFVESVDVMLLESFPLQVRVGVAGQLSDPCTTLGEPRVRRDGDTFRVELPTTRDPAKVCAQVLVPFETTVPLDVHGLPKGTYTVDVEGTTASFTFDRDNALRQP